MNLYLVQWGYLDKTRAPFRFAIKKQEHVWASNSNEARKYGININNKMIVKAEEVYAALQYPNMEIIKVAQGDQL